MRRCGIVRSVVIRGAKSDAHDVLLVARIQDCSGEAQFAICWELTRVQAHWDPGEGLYGLYFAIELLPVTPKIGMGNTDLVSVGLC